MAQENNTPLTEKNAAFVACQKVATADVVTTEYSLLLPAGIIEHENISIYVVVAPKGPEISEGIADFVHHAEKLKELELLMRERAGIGEHDQVWYTEKITPASIESAFERIELNNKIAKNGLFENSILNTRMTIITERHT